MKISKLRKQECRMRLSCPEAEMRRGRMRFPWKWFKEMIPFAEKLARDQGMTITGFEFDGAYIWLIGYCLEVVK